MALHQATLASDTLRQVSVRPSWNLRVAADSYVGRFLPYLPSHVSSDHSITGEMENTYILK